MTHILKIVAFGLVLSACGVGIGPKTEKKETHALDASKITAVKVSGGNGDITVQPSADTNGSVEYTKRTPKFSLNAGDCRGKDHVEGTTLVVEVDEDKLANCEMDITIHVPATVAVTADVKDGNLSIKDMKSTINASSKDGNVDANFVKPDGDQPACNGSFSAKDGNLSISVGYAPVAGTLSAETSDGNIKLHLVDGTSFKLSEDHKDGNFNNDLAPNPNAPFAVSVKSKDGNVKIVRN